MNKIKKLAGETVLYGLGTILPRTLNFLLVILHTRIFSPDDYGIFTYLYAWGAFLNVIFSFGMETAYFRFATKEGADEPRIFQLTQTFIFTLSFSLTLIFIVFSDAIARELKVPEHPQFISWLALLLFFDAIVSIPFAKLRLQKKSLKFASAKLINVAIQVGLNLYFLLVIYKPSFGIGYLILANLIANSFYLFLFAKSLISWRPVWDREVFASLLRYSFPIMLTGLAGMMNELFSRTMFLAWLPENFYPGKTALDALGIFGAAIKFSVIMNLAVQAFRFAAEPFFFSHAIHKDSPWLFAKVNHYFTIVCCFILLGVTVNLDILKYFVDKAYWDGLGVVPILLTAVMFLGIYYNYSAWFKLTDRTYFGTLITIGGVVITISANYFLLPRWGYLGSSWATLMCYFSMAMACYGLGQKYYPMPYKIIQEFGYLFFVLILIEVSKLITLNNQFLLTGCHFLVMLFFLAVTYWLERNYWYSSVE